MRAGHLGAARVYGQGPPRLARPSGAKFTIEPVCADGDGEFSPLGPTLGAEAEMPGPDTADGAPERWMNQLEAAGRRSGSDRGLDELARPDARESVRAGGAPGRGGRRRTRC